MKVNVRQKKQAIRRLIQALSPAKVERAFRKPMEKMAVYVSTSKLHGQVLGIVSGNLSRSVVPSIRVNGLTASFGTALGYGKVWEKGLGNRKARPWAKPGAEEYIGSGEFGKLFIKALLNEVKA